MSFDNIRFPTAISRGCSGGPERRTEIVTTASGHEERNSRWADSRRRYNAGFGVKSLDDLHAVIDFFEERRGRLHAFRWKDPIDYKSCKPNATITPDDQTIATADGKEISFQLVKNYGSGLRNHQRKITKPVLGTVVIAVDGIVHQHVDIDDLNGRITFKAGDAPKMGAVITAGYEFDVPVRFDTDQISVNLHGFGAGEIPEIPIIEVRL